MTGPGATVLACARRAASALLLVWLSACGGGSGGVPVNDSAAQGPADCDGECASPGTALAIADVKRVLAQAIAEARLNSVDATIAVVDRVGNVLAVHRMAEVSAPLELTTRDSEAAPMISGGLEGLILPGGSNGDALGAITKAITGAYLSSEGNAFSTRTANQIVQEHFNPGELNQPSGPLFGVQFSQLACSDFTLSSPVTASGPGPQRSPLGLSADPGGFPLYKNGAVVGGVGVIADGIYGIDRNILDRDDSVEERIALAATSGLAAASSRRADVITVDGKTLRFSDLNFDDLAASPDQAPAYDSLGTDAGTLIAVTGYSDGQLRAGLPFGAVASGVAAVPRPSGVEAFGFYDAAGQPRFPTRSGSDATVLAVDPLSVEEVDVLLDEALRIAERARAQIRRPLGTSARVTISIVDTLGAPLGMLRSRDAPLFGADVSLQKARTAALFSSRDAGDFLEGITEPAQYLAPDLSPAESIRLGDYVEAARLFVGPQALQDGTAFSDRAGGNLSRPFYPDGIRGNPAGPFSKSFGDNRWSVFSTGLQLDLVINQLLAHVVFALDASADDAGDNCVASQLPRIAGGIQIFPGSVPIYRGDVLIGGIGVSGDGVDQDDMIAFLGVHNAGEVLGSLNNAPAELRADRLSPGGSRLRYIQCPQSPFNGSDEQQVCDGK